MAKGTLEFTLPEEQQEFDLAQAGGELAAAVSDLDQKLRALHKHGFSQKPLTAEDARKMLREVLDERGMLWVLGF